MSGILQGTPVRPSHPQFIPSRAYARLLAELPRFDDTPVETTYLVNWPRRTGKTTLVTSLVSALDQDASTHLTRLIVPFDDKAVERLRELASEVDDLVDDPVDRPPRRVMMVDEWNRLADRPDAWDLLAPLCRAAEARRIILVLAGAAEPADFADKRVAIGLERWRSLSYEPFSAQVLLESLDRLGLPGALARIAVDEALDWTSGHPYLTFAVLSVLEDIPPEEERVRPAIVARVDALLGRGDERVDDLFYRVGAYLDAQEQGLGAILDVLERTRQGLGLSGDHGEAARLLRSVGVIRRGADSDHFFVNRMFSDYFGFSWTQERRQRQGPKDRMDVITTTVDLWRGDIRLSPDRRLLGYVRELASPSPDQVELGAALDRRIQSQAEWIRTTVAVGAFLLFVAGLGLLGTVNLSRQVEASRVELKDNEAMITRLTDEKDSLIDVNNGLVEENDRLTTENEILDRVTREKQEWVDKARALEEEKSDLLSDLQRLQTRSTGLKQELQRKEAELAETSEALESQRAELAKVKKQVDAALERLKQTDKEKAELVETIGLRDVEIERLKGEVKTLTDEKATLEASSTKLEQDLQQKETELAKIKAKREALLTLVNDGTTIQSCFSEDKGDEVEIPCVLEKLRGVAQKTTP